MTYNVIDEEKKFNFHPYGFTPEGTSPFGLLNLHI